MIADIVSSRLDSVLLDHLGIANDRVERRSQLMTHVGDEPRLRLIGLLRRSPSQQRLLRGRVMGRGLLLRPVEGGAKRCRQFTDLRWRTPARWRERFSA